MCESNIIPFLRTGAHRRRTALDLRALKVIFNTLQGVWETEIQRERDFSLNL